MDDISTLVMSVKSDGISDGAKALNDLTDSAVASEQASKDLADSFAAFDASVQKATGTSQAFATAQGGSTSALDKLAASMNSTTTAITANAAATTGLTASMQGVTAASSGVAAATASVGAAADDAGGHVSGYGQIVREVFVMGHELAMGNTSRLVGSLMVFANATGVAGYAVKELGAATDAAGVSLGVVVGVFAAIALVVGGVVAAFALGAKEQKAFTDSLILSGNYAGTTTQGLRDMAAAAVAAGGSISTANEVVQKLAASGKFTADEIGTISKAAVGMDQAFGVPIDTTIADFEKLSSVAVTTTKASHEALSKAVEELNDKYHTVTVAQFAVIETATQVGDTEKAVAEIDKDMAQAMADRAAQSRANLGYLAKAWDAVKDSIGGAWNAMKQWGATPDPSSTSTVKAMQAEVTTLQNQLTNLGGGAVGGKTAEYLNSQIAGLQESIKLQQQYTDGLTLQARQQGQNVQIAQQGEHAIRDIINAADSRNKQLKAENDLERENTSYAQAQLAIQKQLADTPGDTATLAMQTKLEAAHQANLDYIKQEAVAKQAGMDTSKTLRAEDLADLADYYNGIKAQDAMALQQSKNQADKMGGDQESELATRKAIYDQENALADEQLAKQQAIFAKFQSMKNTPQDREQNLKMLQQAEIAAGNTHSQIAAQEQADIEQVAAKELAAHNQLMNNINGENQAQGVAIAQQVKAAQTALTTDQQKLQSIGQLKSVQDTQRAQRLQDQNDELAHQIELKQFAEDEIDLTGTLGAYQKQEMDAEIAQMTKILTLRTQDIATVKQLAAEQAQLEAATATTKQIDDALAAGKLFATGMTAAFGAVGTAIGAMDTALLQYAKDQDLASQQYIKNIQAGMDQQKAAAIQDKANTQASLTSFASMTQAAEGYFAKGSTGYTAMADASKVFHAAEAILQATSLAKQLSSIAQSVFAYVTGEGTKQAATVESTAVQVAANATADASNQASIPGAVAAGGAQMFAQSGWGGFAGIALMVAAMAALGATVSGGGGGAENPAAAANVQKTQGTGTVFGDATAQSNSIQASITLLSQNSSQMLPLTSQMLSALNQINAGINGVSNILQGQGAVSAQSMGITTGKTPSTISSDATDLVNNITKALGGNIVGGAISGFLGGLTNNISNFLFGSSSSNVTDTGLQLSGTVGGLQQGQGISNYANVTTTSKGAFGGLFGGNSTSNSVQTQAASQVVTQQFGMIFQSLQTTLEAAATAVGGSATAVGDAIGKIPVAAQVSLQGLTGTALTNALNAVLSNTMDKITSTLVSENLLPDVTAFAQVGESYTTTLARVATGVEDANVSLGQLGITAINFTDIINKQGDVATQIVQQSLEAVQTQNGVLSGVGQIIQASSDASADLITLYQSLIAVQGLMKDAGLNASTLNQAMVSGAGGVSQLTSDLQTYTKSYFTSAQQLSSETADMSAQFKALGVTMPTTRQGFVDLVTAAQAAGNPTLEGQLLNLASSFDTLQTNMGNAAGVISQADVAIQSATAAFNTLSTAISAAKSQEAANYAAVQAATDAQHQQNLDNITAQGNAMTAALQATEAARTDALNHQLANDSAEIAASQNAATAEQDSISNLTSLINSLNTAITATSTISPADAYNQAMQTLQSVAASGNLSDPNLSTAIAQIGKDNSGMFSTLSDYLNAQAKAQTALTSIQTQAGTQLTAAQQQLAATQATTTAVEADQTATQNAISSMATDDANSVAAQTKTLTDAENARYAAQQATDAANDAAVNSQLDGLLSTAQAQLNAINGVNASVVTVGNAFGQFGAAIAAALGTKGVTSTAATNMLNNLPKLAVGTNSVPDDMFAQIHKGERVIPAADNVALMKRLNAPDNTTEVAKSNTDLAQSIAKLINTIQAGDSAKMKNSNRSLYLLKKWETNGLPPTRSSV